MCNDRWNGLKCKSGCILPTGHTLATVQFHSQVSLDQQLFCPIKLSICPRNLWQNILKNRAAHTPIWNFQQAWNNKDEKFVHAQGDSLMQIK